MAKAAEASRFEVLSISKNDREIPVEKKKIAFDYYESILSPCTTATLSLFDTGFSAYADSKYDRQERLTTLSSALPIASYDTIFAKIASKYGSLDFLSRPFRINGSTKLSMDSNREGLLLHMVSEPGLRNLQTPISKKYSGQISDSVKTILAKELKIPESNFVNKDGKSLIETTQNSYSFSGRGLSVFDNIIDLSTKSIPISGNPGYFFYENQDGFNFKSIDSMISQEPKEEYFRNDVLKTPLTEANDFIILSHSQTKNQNLMTALKSGVYVSRNIFFHPFTFEHTQQIFKLDPKTLTVSLGKEIEIPKEIYENNFGRTHLLTLDVGTLDNKIYGDINNNPTFYKAKSSMRYNVLFNQRLDIVIPCNASLKAGDTIKCNFEAVTADNKAINPMDPVMSGNYLIVHLCHHFDSLRSFTSLTLVRDTYGIYTNKK